MTSRTDANRTRPEPWPHACRPPVALADTVVADVIVACMPVAPEPLIPAPYLRPHLPARGAQWHRPDGVKRGQGRIRHGLWEMRCRRSPRPGSRRHALIIRSAGLGNLSAAAYRRPRPWASFVDVARWQLVP